MKKIKLLVLVALVFLLSGCDSWSDIYSKYSTTLDKGISCKYYYSKDNYMGLSTIELSADKDGIYATYNDASKMLILSNSGYDGVHYDILNSGTPLMYNNFDYQSFLDYYVNYNTCPKNIYLYYDSGYLIVRGICPDATCETFSTGQKSNSGSLNSNSDSSYKCYSPTATECNVYKYALPYQKNKYVYVELGFHKKTDSSIERYFAISDNSKMTGGVMATESDGFSLSFKNNLYLIDLPDNLFKYENSSYIFISASKFRISMNPSGTEYIYYIESSDGKKLVFQGNTSEDTEESTLEITKFNFCDATITDASGKSVANGTLKAMKIIGYVLFVAKILVPLILIVMGSIDLAKGIIASDEKATSETLKSFSKRLIIGIIIFLIPTILNLLIGLVDEMTENTNNFTNCTDCLLDPFGDCKAE